MRLSFLIPNECFLVVFVSVSWDLVSRSTAQEHSSSFGKCVFSSCSSFWLVWPVILETLVLFFILNLYGFWDFAFQSTAYIMWMWPFLHIFPNLYCFDIGPWTRILSFLWYETVTASEASTILLRKISFFLLNWEVTFSYTMFLWIDGPISETLFSLHIFFIFLVSHSFCVW